MRAVAPQTVSSSSSKKWIGRSSGGGAPPLLAVGARRGAVGRGAREDAVDLGGRRRERRAPGQRRPTTGTMGLRLDHVREWSSSPTTVTGAGSRPTSSSPPAAAASHGRLARIEPPAGEAHLAAMAAQVPRAPGEHDLGPAPVRRTRATSTAEWRASASSSVGGRPGPRAGDGGGDGTVVEAVGEVDARPRRRRRPARQTGRPGDDLVAPGADVTSLSACGSRPARDSSRSRSGRPCGLEVGHRAARRRLPPLPLVPEGEQLRRVGRRLLHGRAAYGEGLRPGTTRDALAQRPPGGPADRSPSSRAPRLDRRPQRPASERRAFTR